MPDEERCFICDRPTGRAGASDDSIYWAESGPWCPECSDTLRAEVEADTGSISTLERELAKTTSALHTIQADLSVARRELAEAQRNLTACQDNYARALAEIEVQQEEVGRLQGEKEKGTTRWQDEILKMPPRTRDSGVFLTHERLEAKENAARAEGARDALRRLPYTVDFEHKHRGAVYYRVAIRVVYPGEPWLDRPTFEEAAIRALGEES